MQCHNFIWHNPRVKNHSSSVDCSVFYVMLMSWCLLSQWMLALGLYSSLVFFKNTTACVFLFWWPRDLPLSSVSILQCLSCCLRFCVGTNSVDIYHSCCSCFESWRTNYHTPADPWALFTSKDVSKIGCMGPNHLRMPCWIKKKSFSGWRVLVYILKLHDQVPLKPAEKLQLHPEMWYF